MVVVDLPAVEAVAPEAGAVDGCGFDSELLDGGVLDGGVLDGGVLDGWPSVAVVSARAVVVPAPVSVAVPLDEHAASTSAAQTTARRPRRRMGRAYGRPPPTDRRPMRLLVSSGDPRQRSGAAALIR